MSEDLDWGHEEEVLDNVTIKKLNDLCKTAKELKEKSDALKAERTEIEKEYARVSGKIITYLDHFNMTNHSGEFGMVSKRRKFSVPSPQGDDKIKFFSHLKEKGEFEGMASINHNTLNSYVRRNIEECSGKEIYSEKLTTEEIHKFTPPGLKKPEIHYTMSLKKK